MTNVTMAPGPAVINDIPPMQTGFSGALSPLGPQLIQSLLQSPALQALMMSASRSMFATPAMGYGFGTDAASLDPMSLMLMGGSNPMASLMGGMGGMFGFNPMDPQAQALQQMNMISQAFADFGDDGSDDGDE